MSPIEEADIALVMVAGLEVIADLEDKTALVNACQLVLDGLLDIRIHLPLPRSPEEASCTDFPSGRSAPPQS